jgi:hypothetical protein
MRKIQKDIQSQCLNEVQTRETRESIRVRSMIVNHISCVSFDNE